MAALIIQLTYLFSKAMYITLLGFSLISSKTVSKNASVSWLWYTTEKVNKLALKI